MYCPSCGGEVDSGRESCQLCEQPIPPEFLAWSKEGGTLVGLYLEKRYRVEQFIARGGMGFVYRGTDFALSRPVAIKFLDERYRSDEEVVSRFHREAMTAAGLDHPNIIPIYSVGEHAGHHYFVMKFIDGCTITDLLVSRGRLPLEEGVSLALQICAGLEHIHAEGYVHRDIKPTNIMVDTRGHAYILDFGILRLLSSNLTQTGLVAGTPEYMSPEQARDAKSTDARSDIYSLGAMLFEMLSGRGPFKADTAIDILMKHLNEVPPRLTDIVPDLPLSIDNAVHKALEKEAGKRFQSAAEMAVELQAVLGSVTKPISGIVSRRPVATPLRTAPGASETLALGTPPVSSRAVDDTSTARTVAQSRPGSEVHATMIHGEAEKLGGMKPRRRRRVAMLAALLAAGVIGTILAIALRPGSESDPGKRMATAPLPKPPPKKVGSAAPPPKKSENPPPLSPDAGTTAAKPPPRTKPTLVVATKSPDAGVAPTLVLLDLSSRPSGATVYLGKKRLGKTPLKKKIPAGTHTLSLRKGGYGTYWRKVKVSGPEPYTLKAKLRQLDGKVSIVVRFQGRLSYAAVTIDGKPMGNRPVTERKLRPGKHTVRVTRKGYLPQRRVIRVRAAKNQKVVFELVRR